MREIFVNKTPRTELVLLFKKMPIVKENGASASSFPAGMRRAVCLCVRCHALEEQRHVRIGRNDQPHGRGHHQQRQQHHGDEWLQPAE